jgi:hypothetical protein
LTPIDCLSFTCQIEMFERVSNDAKSSQEYNNDLVVNCNVN